MLNDISIDDPITAIGTPLFGTTAKGEKVLAGTGVVILPHVILTAKHVVDEFVKIFKRDSPPSRDASTDKIAGSMYGFVRSLTGDWIPFRVLKISTSDRSDLALLSVATSEYTRDSWACPTIQLTPPRVGQAINAFGFPGTDLELHDDGNGGATGRIILTPSGTSGTVTEVHHDRRDSVLLPFPCFTTDAQFEGAMSGGPVFHDGRLCGIICSSYDLIDGGPPIGNVVSIWPALALDVYVFAEGGVFESRMLIDLLTAEHAVDIGNFSVSGSDQKQISMRIVTPRSVTFSVISRQSPEVASIHYFGFAVDYLR